MIIHEDITVVQRCQQIIADWLKDMGLELKPSKTRLTHTLHKYEGNVGFNFLGFYVRQHETGNYRAACDSQGNPLGFKTLIIPSKEKQHLHLEEIGRIIDTHKNSPQYALIKRLNPVIRGWANYYSTAVSSEVFSKIDHLTYQKLKAWATHRCAKTNKHNIVNKYWSMSGKDRWRFATKEGAKLTKHSDTAIKGHIKVQGNRSPYDGDWVYWGSRMGKHPEIPTRITKLLKEQQGTCNRCGLTFKLEDLILEFRLSRD